MATIKAFTSLEQSKKLAEILPPESADMHYKVNRHNNESKIFMIPYSELGHYKDNDYQYCVCAYSLTSLLGVLPEYNLQKTDWGSKIEYKVVVIANDDSYASKNYNNPIDAVVDIILKLNKLNLL